MDFLFGPEMSARTKTASTFRRFPMELEASLRRDAKLFTPDMRATVLDIEDTNTVPPGSVEEDAQLWRLGAESVNLMNRQRWQNLGLTQFPAPQVPCLLRGEDIGKLPIETLLCAYLLNTKITLGLVDTGWTAARLRAGHGVLPLQAMLPTLALYLTSVGFEGDAKEALETLLSRIMPRGDWQSHVRRVETVKHCGRFILDNLSLWQQDEPPKTKKPRTKTTHASYRKKTRYTEGGQGTGQHPVGQTRTSPGLA